MKTTLSKSLLCGIIASTFLLANCQKDPTGRVVKADVGTPGQADPAAETAVAEKENLVPCSPEFLKVYTDYITILKNANAEVDKKVEATESRKADLLRFRTDLEDSVKLPIEEINKLKSEVKTKTGKAKKVDGCFGDAAKTIKYSIKDINDGLSKLDIIITNITGVSSNRSDAAIAANKAKEAKAKKQAEDTVYIVSDELNEILDEPSARVSSTSKHFVDGKIAEKSELEANKKNIKAAVCEIMTTPGKLDSDKLVLKVLSSEPAKQENQKIIYSVQLGQLANQGDKIYNISCSLPIQLKKEAGFEKAMGNFLVRRTTVNANADYDEYEASRNQTLADSAKSAQAELDNVKKLADVKKTDEVKTTDKVKKTDEIKTPGEPTTKVDEATKAAAVKATEDASYDSYEAKRNQARVDSAKAAAEEARIEASPEESGT